MSYHVGTRAEVGELQGLDAKARGLPLRGRHVGGGRHVEMTDDPNSPGWTRWHDDPRQHPVSGELWAYRVVDIPEGTLTEAERATVQARKAAAVELDETWEPEQDVRNERTKT